MTAAFMDERLTEATERASGCLVRLLFFNDLAPDDQPKVVGTVKDLRSI